VFPPHMSKFFLEKFVRMQEFDDEQRDLIPIGARLRHHVNKYSRMGVFVASDRVLGDYEDEPDVEWKHFAELFILASSAVWQTIGLSNNLPRGYGAAQRVGRRVRVVGVELSYQIQLRARTSGTQTNIPTTLDYTTSVTENGPAYFRIMLVVAGENDPSAPSYPNIFDHTGYPCSQFDDDAFENYVCIFDKSYVLPAAGGKILDHIFIDCNFIQEFADETLPTATSNFLECRYFLDEGEGIALPTGRLQVSIFFDDD